MAEPLQSQEEYSEPLGAELEPEPSGSRLIQSVLTPAIRFWLSTQVDRAENLAIAIQSRDRQILKGHIPSIQLAADHICYQGLHLGRLEVSATNIRVNWWGIARGQSLQLLAPIPIQATMCIRESDLNRSLQVEMFAQALSDLIAQDLSPIFEVDTGEGNPPLSGATPPPAPQIDSIALRTDALVMTIAFPEGDRTAYRYVLTKLVLHNGHTLRFHQPQLLDHAEQTQGRSLPQLESVSIDLGETVELTHLNISLGQMTCKGTLWVQP